MSGLFAAIPILLAQAANPPAGGGGVQDPGSYRFFIIAAAIGLWFYLLMIRPQQKQDKQRRGMLDRLKKNDKVLTSAGIYGTVVSVDEAQNRVLVRIDDDRGVKVAFSKASIVQVLDGPEKEREKPAEAAKAAPGP